MNLQSNDFELFGVARQFAQDRAALDARWKELQREAHPDKFAAQGDAAQRLAMQWSVRINEAYQRLKDPLKRAAYLCELAGAPINAHSNMPAASRAIAGSRAASGCRNVNAVILSRFRPIRAAEGTRRSRRRCKPPGAGRRPAGLHRSRRRH